VAEPRRLERFGKVVDEFLDKVGGASRDRLSFTTNIREALSAADLVQENGSQ